MLKFQEEMLERGQLNRVIRRDHPVFDQLLEDFERVGEIRFRVAVLAVVFQAHRRWHVQRRLLRCQTNTILRAVLILEMPRGAEASCVSANENRQTVAQLFAFEHRVRGEDDRRVRGTMLENETNVSTQQWIDLGRGLIEQEKRGRTDETQGEMETTTCSTAQMRDEAMAIILQLELFEDQRVQGGRMKAVQTADVGDGLLNGQRREADVILGTIANGLGTALGNVSTRGSQFPDQHAKGRCLP